MSRKSRKAPNGDRRAVEGLVARLPNQDDAYDPGATLCGHGVRPTQRSHYLGGGLWVCFTCFAKLLLGGRQPSPREETP